MIRLSIHGEALRASMQPRECGSVLFPAAAYRSSAGLGNRKMPRHQCSARIGLKIRYITQEKRHREESGYGRMFPGGLEEQPDALPSSDTL